MQRLTPDCYQITNWRGQTIQTASEIKEAFAIGRREAASRKEIIHIVEADGQVLKGRSWEINPHTLAAELSSAWSEDEC